MQNVIEAVTGLALLQGNLSLAGALYIGFVGLLRTGEKFVKWFGVPINVK